MQDQAITTLDPDRNSQSKTWFIQLANGVNARVSGVTDCQMTAAGLHLTGPGGFEQWVPSHHFIEARTVPPATDNSQDVSAENETQQAEIPPQIKETFLQEAEREAARFVLRDAPDHTIVYDAETGQEISLPASIRGSEVFSDLVKLANRGHERAASSNYESTLDREAVVVMTVVDETGEPHATMDKELFDRLRESGAFTVLTTPVIQFPDGQQVRVEFQEEEARLYKSVLKIASPHQMEPVAGKMKVSSMESAV